MKMPRRPPFLDFTGHFPKVESKISDVVRAVPSALVRGKYLHWDNLLHREPPKGLSLEDWWFGLKLQRMNKRYIPLSDINGKRFYYVDVDHIQEILHDIDFKAGGAIESRDTIVNPDLRDKYYTNSIINEAITSSQLEGATTTRPVAKDMIRTGRNPRTKSERMILNNYLTMQRIDRLKEAAMTQDEIFELHRSITEETLDDAEAGGRFRTSAEKIYVADDSGQVAYFPPPASELPGRMAALCEFANGTSPASFVHPVIRAILIHFWLAFDHPFVDGNGRTARALFYWSMRRSKYWLFEYVSISEEILRAPSQYARAFLYTETDDNDLTYFILYHLEVIKQSIETLHEHVERGSREMQDLVKKTRGLGQLNIRQRELVKHALQHPWHEYTVESHRRSYGIVPETARTDLLGMERLGLLTVSKQGRRLVFLAPSNLEQKLKDL